DIRTHGGAGSADSNALDLRKRVEKQFESRSSGGMCGIPVMNTLHPKPLPDGPCISTNDLKKIQHDLVEGQLLGWRTRATHAAGIFQPQNGRMVVREDIGRHNALDKAVGFAAATGLDLSQTCLMFSGRISLEIVNKCARARIGLIAAVSAASAQAVVKADSLNMTLIGRLRDENYVIYTHTLRII
ncbi:MAG TPA: formate dehydrogenase accessory sulfurtransferase FdhD, partial [bacterium]|nr:formate dehydrogenase accessory sulfurtransferase FdhD [bacterium]